MVKAMQPARMVELWLNFARVSERGRNGTKPSRCLERPKVDFLQYCSKVGGEMEMFEKKVALQGNDYSRNGVEPKGVQKYRSLASNFWKGTPS